MNLRPVDTPPPAAAPDWRKSRRLVADGFRDLAYMPTGKTEWNATLAAMAYSVWRQRASAVDLGLWAAMHGVPASARCRQLGGDALVCWHGTSAQRAAKIRQVGLIHRCGVWAATDPGIAHGYTRTRSKAFGAGSAMIVFVVSKDLWDAKATPRGDEIVEFHRSIPPECLEYILWSDRIEHVGRARATSPKPWGVACFKRRRGRWIPRSLPPVRLDSEHSYSGLDEWLDLSIRRIMASLGAAAGVEIFSSLYATISPWEALEHERIFDGIERVCGEPKSGRAGLSLFSIP